MGKVILYLLVVCLFSCTAKVKENNKDKIQNNPKKDTTHIIKTKINITDPEVIFFRQSECNTKCELEGKLLNQYYHHDTLFLKIASIQTCGMKYYGEIDYYKNGILNIIIKDISGTSSSCDCVYFFDITVKNIKTKVKKILINDSKINYKLLPPIV